MKLLVWLAVISGIAVAGVNTGGGHIHKKNPRENNGGRTA